MSFFYLTRFYIYFFSSLFTPSCLFSVCFTSSCHSSVILTSTYHFSSLLTMSYYSTISHFCLTHLCISTFISDHIISFCSLSPLHVATHLLAHVILLLHWSPRCFCAHLNTSLSHPPLSPLHVTLLPRSFLHSPPRLTHLYTCHSASSFIPTCHSLASLTSIRGRGGSYQ